ncbi:hypothetical protein [Photobacterium kishitanii]|uniref:Uncharacterized protein n=1 Tax=Photobacterium kishitanii TaxID=318456 RepID=A0A2T3KMI9_9GAMM|nr:hypothetical protein [Photobacterium kishitanii]PSV00998.1 hypothetical protein C9J27_02940 [Photobacterium kishitanii]
MMLLVIFKTLFLVTDEQIIEKNIKKELWVENQIARIPSTSKFANFHKWLLEVCNKPKKKNTSLSVFLLSVSPSAYLIKKFRFLTITINDIASIVFTPLAIIISIASFDSRLAFIADQSTYIYMAILFIIYTSTMTQERAQYLGAGAAFPLLLFTMTLIVFNITGWSHTHLMDVTRNVFIVYFVVAICMSWLFKFTGTLKQSDLLSAFQNPLTYVYTVIQFVVLSKLISVITLL